MRIAQCAGCGLTTACWGHPKGFCVATACQQKAIRYMMSEMRREAWLRVRGVLLR